MRKQLFGASAAAGALFLFMPATSSADDFDRRCSDGSDPIVVVHVHENPLLKGTVRVLCLGG